MIRLTYPEKDRTKFSEYQLKVRVDVLPFLLVDVTIFISLSLPTLKNAFPRLDSRNYELQNFL